MDWTSVLGVPVGASVKSIKSAFRRLTAEHHPDVGGDPDRYRRIVAAYESALKEPEKTARLRSRRPAAEPGKSRFARLHLTVFESITGGPFELDTLRLTVPSGVTHGQRLRVRGQGGPGRHGGPPGDLVVEILVTPDPMWIRDDPSLIHRLQVSWLEAYRGDAVPLRTPWGDRTLRLRAGSEHGERITCPGYGLAGGDLIVILELVAPVPGQRDVERALEAAVFP